jgi:GNAT superfamily N-acetyltransferase
VPPPAPTQPPPPTGDGKDYRIRALKRGDRDAVFKLLATDGWNVPANEQETAISWVVQHPEMESFVAHDAAAFSRVIGIITMSHRPQLRLGGRVGSIDLFLVAAEHRGKGIGTDLFLATLRRAEALACKRVEVQLPGDRDDRHEFFEAQGFARVPDGLFVKPMKPIK